MVYEGCFRDDMRDGHGTLTVDLGLNGGGELKYIGEHKDDKRNGAAEELSLVDHTKGCKAVFRGSLDENEQMAGIGTFETQEQDPQQAGKIKIMRYTGDFEENSFQGKGQIEYMDTGAVFKGQFVHNRKHGEATFKTKDGREYKGVYEHNSSIREKDDFGPRF